MWRIWTDDPRHQSVNLFATKSYFWRGCQIFNMLRGPPEQLSLLATCFPQKCDEDVDKNLKNTVSYFKERDLQVWHSQRMSLSCSNVSSELSQSHLIGFNYGKHTGYSIDFIFISSMFSTNEDTWDLTISCIIKKVFVDDWNVRQKMLSEYLVCIALGCKRKISKIV